MTTIRSRVLAPLTLLLLLAGCVGLPQDGDVRVHPDVSQSDPDAGFPYEPRPPQAGESPTEIVRHFLDAMTANPITTSVARQFLTERARGEWQPDAAIITYADLGTPVGGTQVEVGLVGAHRIDAGGRWAGALAEEESRLDFDVVTEDGEWRIDELPDAMVVPDNWFADRYVQMNLHFFDPSGRVLVPEPVFVPRGGQAATSLVRGLLRGPARGQARVEQSFIPTDLSLDVLVAEPVDGFTEVALTGDVGALDAATSELMVAQFAWTLRQIPGLVRFRLTLNGMPLGASGVATDVSVSRGEPYDPAVPGGWSDAFALEDDQLVNVAETGTTPVEGDHEVADWDEFAVDLTASRVAAVTAGGRRITVAPLNGSLAPDTWVQGVDLLTPGWDHTGMLWTLDRRQAGAVVTTFVDGRGSEVEIPGITGERVKDFLVSRDGTRVVALIAGRSDRVVVSRVVRKASRLRGTAAVEIWADPAERLALRALAWRTPTEVLVLRRLGPQLNQVVRRSVDGSAAVGRDVTTELVRDRVVALVSTPVVGLPAWALAGDGTWHVVASEAERFVPADGLRALTYPG